MRIMDKMDSFYLMAQSKIQRFLNEEDGDTNFISILVLLGIALGLAGIFLGFKDQVLGWVNKNIGSFFGTSI